MSSNIPFARNAETREFHETTSRVGISSNTLRASLARPQAA
uniref:Uncharacterized protein n=1 Tax=Arundo donax TaxID=35708 RepID=A0A0A9GVQ3_ARUDO